MSTEFKWLRVREGPQITGGFAYLKGSLNCYSNIFSEGQIETQFSNHRKENVLNEDIVFLLFHMVAGGRILGNYV